MMTDTNEQRTLSPEEHWELHQGVWKSMGCDMVLFSKFYKDKYSYLDRNNKYKYTYYTKDKRVERMRWTHEFKEYKSLG